MEELAYIKEVLEKIKPDLLQKYNVKEIGLFGSVLRNDFTKYSDVDIIIDFSKPIGVEFIDLADFIEKKINRKVDLVSKNGIKPKYFHAIEKDIVYV